MKQIRIHGPDDVRLDDLREPQVGPDDALLAVAACGIEIGTRVALHRGAAGFGLGNGGPDGGFTPRLLVRGASQGRSLFPIPDEMPFEIAALAEPLGVGMNAIDRVDVRPGDRVAVLGAGPIGLSAIATLHDRGIEDVVAIDFSQRRLDVARKLGARDTFAEAFEVARSPDTGAKVMIRID